MANSKKLGNTALTPFALGFVSGNATKNVETGFKWSAKNISRGVSNKSTMT